MGRVSKRKAAVGMIAPDANVKKRYKAGIYARLSADINEQKNESIDVQIEIAKKFVEQFNQNNQEKIDIVDCYQDLGKTGTNFEREGFKRLMQDIRLREIDCVIVKDLSRFGRNYLEAGNYIEKIFPFLGVRFIAVSDGIDTGEKGNDTKQMTSEIKNLVNDMYAKDFSAKAKTWLKQKREAGSYVGGPPPYGYKVVWIGKIRKLVPDENTEEIVRHIYQLFIEKESYTAVADDLNHRKINPPAIYKKTKEVYCPPDAKYKGWDKSSVERLLKSETYTGILTQGKTSITARNEKNRVMRPKGEWVVIPNAHEALVDMELYQKAQQIRKKIQDITMSHKHPSKDIPIGENIFDHVLYCGVCQRKMTRTSYVATYEDGSRARRDGYLCLNSVHTKVSVCPESNRISRQELVNILMPLLHTEFTLYLDKPGSFTDLGKEQIYLAIQQTEKDIKSIQNRIKGHREEEIRVYVNYREGKLPQKEYVSYKMKQEECLQELNRREKELKTRRSSLEKVQERYRKAIRSMFQIRSKYELTTEMVDALIEKIYVYPGKRIEVYFSYTNEMLEGVR